MAKQLLVETRPVKFQILEAADVEQKKLMKIRCDEMSICDQLNGNTRVYPLKIWEREITKLQESINGSRNIGAGDHPADGQSRIASAGLLWTKIGMNGNVTFGEAIIPNTDQGKNIQALIEAGAVLDLSSRAWGTLERQQWKGKMADVATEDLSLTTFDAVIGGSVENAHMRVVNENKHKGGSMEWKEIIEGLRKENPEAFAAYEKNLREGLSADFEKRVIDEMKKNKVDEGKLREKWDGEIAVAKEALKAKVNEAIEARNAIDTALAGLCAHIGEKYETKGGDPVPDAVNQAAQKQIAEFKKQLEAFEKKYAVEQAKVAELQEQLTARDSQTGVAAEIEALTKDHKHGKLLAEKLSDCKSAEEVKTRFDKEKTWVEKLLVVESVQNGDSGGDNGKGHVEGSKDATGFTFEQQKARRAAGLSS